MNRCWAESDFHFINVLVCGNPPPPSDEGELFCTDEEPTFSLVEGFETYPPGDVDVMGSPWKRYTTSNFGSSFSTTWVASCTQNLDIQSSLFSNETDYVDLELPARPSQLNIELKYTPDDFSVWSDFAAIGLADTSNGTVRSVFKVSGAGSELIMYTPQMIEPVVIFDELQAGQFGGSPVHNYLRLEIDFCAGEVQVFAGPDENAQLVSTVEIGRSEAFDAFYVTGGVSPTYIDDIVIWTPVTNVDRTPLCPMPAPAQE